MALFCVTSLFAEATVLDPIELYTRSGELKIVFKEDAVISVVPGTSETFVIQKYGKVFVGEQVLEDIEIDDYLGKGFSLKGIIPRHWDGKTPVSMTVSLDTNYQGYQRGSWWNYNDNSIRFVEVRDAVIVRFQKKIRYCCRTEKRN